MGLASSMAGTPSRASFTEPAKPKEQEQKGASAPFFVTKWDCSKEGRIYAKWARTEPMNKIDIIKNDTSF